VAVPQKRPDRVFKTKRNGVGAVFETAVWSKLLRFLGVRVMPQVHFRNRKVGRATLMRAALGIGLAGFFLCTDTDARAADDDDSPTVMGKIMETFGLRDPKGSYAGIDYNERSPLVVPPTRDLPPPVADTAPPAPNWPKDQDMIRRAKAKAEEKKVAPKPDSVSDASRPLRPNELDPAGAPRVNTPIDSSASANTLMSDPYDHGVKKSLFSGIFSSKTEYTTFTGEPSRQTLTDPPPGYLTPSPDQPYGVGQAPSNYKIKTLGERVEPTR
jgi:hypothetical protein